MTHHIFHYHFLDNWRTSCFSWTKDLTISICTCSCHPSDIINCSRPIIQRFYNLPFSYVIAITYYFVILHLHSSTYLLDFSINIITFHNKLQCINKSIADLNKIYGLHDLHAVYPHFSKSSLSPVYTSLLPSAIFSTLLQVGK